MAEMPDTRCRLILIAPDAGDAAALETMMAAALAGGDVAAVIVPGYGLDEAAFQRRAERLVPIIQNAGAAAMIVDDTRIAGRVGADGVHLENARASMAETMARFDGKLMFGAGGARTRHDALELGEVRPDYVFFGRIGYDNKPEPHPRNLELGRWWAEFVEIPCVVMAGAAIDSITEVAETGAEFVAAGTAVFAGPLQPGAAVTQANVLLDAAAQPETVP